jgi:hypothetical protein
MADDPNTKQVKITGGAAAALEPSTYETMEGGKRNTSRKRAMKNPRVTAMKDGGGSTSPGTMVQLASTHVPGPPISVTGVASNLSMKGATVAAEAPSISLTGGKRVIAGTAGATATAATAETPVAKDQKVVLKPKVSKVVLGAKITKKVHHTKRNKTIKKVAVSLGGLSSKLSRAKTIRNKASKHTLEEVKRDLTKAGLIKADTKAPEDVLRSMYADFMLLKKRAI